MEVTKIIKNGFEIEFLKRLLLDKNEYNLFNYQFKHINLRNYNASLEYLKSLRKNKKIRYEELQNCLNNNEINKK